MSVFNQVAIRKPQHNVFDLSHERKFDMFAGILTPCFLAETVPNDHFTISTNQLVRMAPMVAPVMHRFNVYTHFFFVPNRILWDGWEDFINGGVDGMEAPVFPFFTIAPVSSHYTVGSLADHLGLPVTQPRGAAGFQVSAMPFAAYWKIWYEYYRDQNLATEYYDVFKGAFLEDGSNDALWGKVGQMAARAWEHDYFTSALPWTQRGPEATIPLGETAQVVQTEGQENQPTFWRKLTGGVIGTPRETLTVNGGAVTGASENSGDNPYQIYMDGQWSVDLSTATAASINDLRRAFRLQEWLELNARAGARYNETIIAHFGISPGDARLQRPEYLGGSVNPIVISEVLQTSSVPDETTPQGNMAGHGVSMGGKNVVKYTCREHGFIMGLVSILPKPAYQQGLAKHWFKFDKFDYYWRSFANIGEQPILNKELYFNGDDGVNEDVFGYTPRYAEYKYMPDTVHGQFRTTLDFWHAGRKFANRPLLNLPFVSMQYSEISRIFAVENAEQFYVQMYHKVKARRPMPYFGTPTL